MTAKRKEQIEKLILDLKESGNLTATDFFQAARNTTWGESSASIVEDYNMTLGRLFGRGEINIMEVRKAMNP